MQAPFLVGILVSAVTGAMVIALFLRFLRTHSLRFFVVLPHRSSGFSSWFWRWFVRP